MNDIPHPVALENRVSIKLKSVLTFSGDIPTNTFPAYKEKKVAIYGNIHQQHIYWTSHVLIEHNRTESVKTPKHHTFKRSKCMWHLLWEGALLCASTNNCGGWSVCLSVTAANVEGKHMGPIGISAPNEHRKNKTKDYRYTMLITN